MRPTTSTPRPHVAVDCYVRASTMAAPVGGLVETLSEYDEEGIVDELAIEIWPEEVSLAADTKKQPALDRYDRLRAWADDRGVSLEPAFARRERTSLANDGSDAVLVFPMVCLAVRVDGKLVSVAPHSTATGTYTVADALADIVSLSSSSPEDGPAFSLDRSVRSTGH